MSEFAKGVLKVIDTGGGDDPLKYLIAEEKKDGDLEYFAWAYNDDDARLIAAAPDMYEALKLTCIVCFRDSPENCKDCVVKKALKKAEGKQ